MGTFEDILEECGWQKVSKPKKQLIPPHIVAQIQQEVEIPALRREQMVRLLNQYTPRNRSMLEKESTNENSLSCTC